MSEKRIAGALAAAVTPLRDDGRQLDEAAIEALLELYRGGRLDGLLVLGTTGEGILLDERERRLAAELFLAGRGPLRVIVHCGAQTTAQTTALAAHAAEAGADAVAVIPPPYFALGVGELTAHLAAAAAACAPLPFYAYEYADRSGYGIPVEVIERLRERLPNLVGMKVSDAPFERLAPYLALGLDIFVGAEPLIARGLAHGAVGAVSGVAAAFPAEVASLVRDPTAANAALVESIRATLSKHSFQAAVKAALAARGVPIRADVRAPLQPLSDESVATLRADVQQLFGARTPAPGVSRAFSLN